MVSRELIEKIAARYNIGVSCGLGDTGGFITDGTGTVKPSVLEDFKEEFALPSTQEAETSRYKLTVTIEEAYKNMMDDNNFYKTQCCEVVSSTYSDAA